MQPVVQLNPDKIGNQMIGSLKLLRKRQVREINISLRNQLIEPVQLSTETTKGKQLSQSVRSQRHYYRLMQLCFICLLMYPYQLFAQISKVDQLNFDGLRDCSIDLRWDEFENAIVDVYIGNRGSVFGERVFVRLTKNQLDIEESLARVREKGRYAGMQYSQIFMPKKNSGQPGISIIGLRIDASLKSAQNNLSKVWGGHFMKVPSDGYTKFEFMADKLKARNIRKIKPEIFSYHDEPNITNLVCDSSF